MKQTFLLIALVSLYWTACENNESSVDPIPEPEMPIFPDMTGVKIDEVYRNGNLYLRFTYNEDLLPDSLIYTVENGDPEEIGQVHYRIKFEYDENSRLVSFRRLPGDCCFELNYEVEYVNDNLIKIIEQQPGELYHVIKSYNFDQEGLLSISEHSYDQDGNEFLQRQNTYLYNGDVINQVIYYRNNGVRTYDAQFDDKINPFYGIPTDIIGDVFPGLEYAPNNLLSLEGEHGTAILNNFTYNEKGFPTDVEVITDNLQMKITYND